MKKSFEGYLLNDHYGGLILERPTWKTNFENGLSLLEILRQTDPLPMIKEKWYIPCYKKVKITIETFG